MAFEKSVSSDAVLQGILALSAYHPSDGGAGIEHNFTAINALSASIRVSTEPRDRFYQLAEHDLGHLRGKLAFRFAPVVCFESRARRIIRYDDCDV